MLKDLSISPLRMWYRWINPNRAAEEPTPAMKFGSALHCAVLEPKAFLDRYACEIDPADYPGCLVTINDLRGWLSEHGIKPKGTRKDEVIAQVQGADSTVPILDVIAGRAMAANAGKTTFKKDDWTRIYGAAQSLLSEPRVQEILKQGEPEAMMMATDQDTGMCLKARMDWMTPKLILDVKTFSQKGEKTISKTVTDAIWYEDYHGQMFFYSLVRGWPKWRGECVLAFVESEPPYETRIRVLRPVEAGSPSMLWERARHNTKRLIGQYAEYVAEFGLGEKAWRYAQDVSVLDDLEFPQLSYS
jgi:hypothetical protein